MYNCQLLFRMKAAVRRLLIVASHVPLLTVALALSVHSVWFSQQKIAATLQQPAHCISSEVVVVCYKQARSQGKELTVARNCGDALHQWFPALKAMRVRVMMSFPPPQLHSLLKPFGSPCQDHVRLDQAGVDFLLLPRPVHWPSCDHCGAPNRRGCATCGISLRIRCQRRGVKCMHGSAPEPMPRSCHMFSKHRRKKFIRNVVGRRMGRLIHASGVPCDPATGLAVVYG